MPEDGSIYIQLLHSNNNSEIYLVDADEGSWNVDEGIRLEATPYYGTDGSYLDGKSNQGRVLTFSVTCTSNDYLNLRRVREYDEYPYVLISSELDPMIDGGYVLSQFTSNALDLNWKTVQLEFKEAVGIYNLMRFPGRNSNYHISPIIQPHLYEDNEYVGFLRKLLSEALEVAINSLGRNWIVYLQHLIQYLGFNIDGSVSGVLSSDWVAAYRGMLNSLGFYKGNSVYDDLLLNDAVLDRIKY